MAENKSEYREWFREVASIVIAVLFALGVEAWWSDRQAEAKKDEVLLLVYSELSDNLALVERSLEHHKGHLDFYREFRQAHPEMTDADYGEIFRHFYKSGISQPARVTSTGWEVAKLTDTVRRIDTRTLRELSDIYTMQDTYRAQWEQGLLGNATRTASSAGEQVEAAVGVIRQTWWLEQSLEEMTRKAIARLDELGLGAAYKKLPTARDKVTQQSAE